MFKGDWLTLMMQKISRNQSVPSYNIFSFRFSIIYTQGYKISKLKIKKKTA